MTWWCAASPLEWTWSPRAYPGVWAFVLVVALSGPWVAWRNGGATRAEARFWWAGVVALWLATDWPLGALGAGYLATAHMLQYLLYTFVAAPLLVLAIPEAVGRRALASPAGVVLRAVCRPAVAAVLVNVVLVVTHAPAVVDPLRNDQLGSFALDVAWLIGGIVLWLPVCGPVPELRPSYAIRCGYLFVAAGLVPMVPGGFLTFADFPLYRLYELAPRVGSLTALGDQQLAGALMKVGNIPLIWPVIVTMMWRWARAEGWGHEPDAPPRKIDVDLRPEPTGIG